jgi:serine/threonine protein kinase
MSLASCPDVRSWQALLEESYQGGATDDWVRHLETCADCRRTLETLAAEPAVWQDTAQGLTETAWEEPALLHVMERLKTEESLLTEDEARSFLQPADKTGLLGMLGLYEVQEEIGRGGMGVVFKALDPDLNRVVAIKVLSPWLASSATARRRFVREGRAAAAVCHEHIVTVHTVNDQDGLPYLVMQYVAGESLQARLDRTSALQVEDIVQIALQTASGLAAAHAHGLIHRDIKPANLLLENGLARVKITDFGLARMADDAQLTQNGVVAGTPEYMAPEQARGEQMDHRADLFSLGSVLYALCTGVPPFRSSTTLAVLSQVNDQTPTSIRQLNPDIPAWLETLIAHLMAKNPTDRFQSAGEVAALLETYLAHLNQPTVVAAPRLPPPSGGSRQSGKFAACRRFARNAALFALALLTAGLIGGLLFQPRPPIQSSASGDFYQDFRGGKPPVLPLTPFGSDVQEVTRSEKEGFRITLPRNRTQTDQVGLELRAPVKGNFEITSSYEILQADVPKSGHGVGFDLFVEIDSPKLDMTEVLRICRVNEGEVYTCARISTDDQGKRTYNHDFIPSTAKSGRLRIARIGREATLWAAEGATGEFKELCRYDLGTEDVHLICVNAFPGHAQNFLDLRILDLRVHSLNSSEITALEQLAERKSDRSRGGLAAVGLLGLIVIVTAFGVWYVAVRSRRGGPVTSEIPVNSKQAESEEGTPISLQCPHCRKGLKARAYLAGKKVRCPYCGLAVPVLAAEKNPSIRTPEQ